MLGVTLGAVDRSKPVVDEGSGLVFSVGYFQVIGFSNLEGSGTGEGDTLSNS